MTNPFVILKYNTVGSTVTVERESTIMRQAQSFLSTQNIWNGISTNKITELESLFSLQLAFV